MMKFRPLVLSFVLLSVKVILEVVSGTQDMQTSIFMVYIWLSKFCRKIKKKYQIATSQREI
jgi:hypothetical protein